MQLHLKTKRTKVMVRLVEHQANSRVTRNKSFTVYDTTLEEMYALLKQAVMDTQTTVPHT